MTPKTYSKIVSIFRTLLGALVSSLQFRQLRIVNQSPNRHHISSPARIPSGYFSLPNFYENLVSTFVDFVSPDVLGNPAGFTRDHVDAPISKAVFFSTEILFIYYSIFGRCCEAPRGRSGRRRLITTARPSIRPRSDPDLTPI